MSSIKKTSTAETLQVLFEDNHLIAVNKRPSDIVQGDKTGDKPLSEVVKEYLKLKYQKPGDVFLGVAHRIDRPVSGVVIFAKTSKALSRLNEQFKNREVQKAYWACVKNKPVQPEGELVDMLLKNSDKNKSFVAKHSNPAAKKASLHYKVLAESNDYFLLEINPKSGRHHQIRVQLANAGMPIKGDVKYGFARTNPDASIHLHARSISILHPVRKEQLTIIAPPPEEALWQYFSQNHDS